MPDTAPTATDGGPAAVEARLVAAARALLPALRERAADTERGRRLPAASDRDFRAAGIYRALQPARYGGFELDYGAQTAIARELGRACASSAWVGGILACHGWIAGMFPDEAQAEIWGDDPDVAIATSFLPVGATVEPLPGGGVTLSGRWRFSSGVDHCGWTILMAMVPAADGPPDPCFVLVPLADCRIEDTWHSAGLAGTGSNDIVVDAVAVPPHRVLSTLDLRGQETPGSRAAGGYLYRLPLFAVFPFNIVGPALGAARGALDAVIDDLCGRQAMTGADLTRLGTVHERLGRAAATLDAADALIDRLRAEIVAAGRSGAEFAMQDRVRYKLDLGYIAQSCCDAVDTLLPLTGGRGLETSHPMQRAWRDVHAVAQHIGLAWDIQTGLYGAVRLGHPSPDPKL